jgi:hypothetical protein
MIAPPRPTAGFRDERLAALRDEQTLRECGLDVAERPGPPGPAAADPWREDDDDLRAARGIGLGLGLACILWLGAFGTLVWAWIGP